MRWTLNRSGMVEDPSYASAYHSVARPQVPLRVGSLARERAVPAMWEREYQALRDDIAKRGRTHPMFLFGVVLEALSSDARFGSGAGLLVGELGQSPARVFSTVNGCWKITVLARSSAASIASV